MIFIIKIYNDQVDDGNHDVDPNDEQGDDKAVEADPHSLESFFLLQISLFLQNEQDQEGLGMLIVMTRLVKIISLDDIKFRCIWEEAE